MAGQHMSNGLAVEKWRIPIKAITIRAQLQCRHAGNQQQGVRLSQSKLFERSHVKLHTKRAELNNPSSEGRTHVNNKFWSQLK